MTDTGMTTADMEGLQTNMKRLMKAVDMIVWFDAEGGIHPTRFRITDADEKPHIIAVDRVLGQQTEKFAGNPILVFDCAGGTPERQRRFQIKYELKTSRWYLSRFE